MKHVFLGLFAILGYTTAMVYEPTTKPEQSGYSQHEVAAMGALVSRVTTAKRVRPHEAWTAKQEVAAVATLFGREGIE